MQVFYLLHAWSLEGWAITRGNLSPNSEQLWRVTQQRSTDDIDLSQEANLQYPVNKIIKFEFKFLNSV